MQPSPHSRPIAPLAERERLASSLVQAEIRRNGQLKYRRVQAAPAGREIVMPDGEVLVPGEDGYGRAFSANGAIDAAE
ncbi:MAG TPA: hypothetical protein VM619_03580 [Luteimonas sp.]|nr:hypothetical protein [Luteimonas sp.]